MPALSDLPTGTVTFLFTDIEGSTRLVQGLGDAYPPLLEQHHDIVRSAVEANDGLVVSTEGDSFFAVFPAAPAALRAAVEAQLALERHPWSDGKTVVWKNQDVLTKGTSQIRERSRYWHAGFEHGLKASFNHHSKKETQICASRRSPR